MIKLHSDVQEQLLYYERDESIYKLLRCMGENDKDFYVVQDKEDNPLLMCLEKEPAMKFFFYKCKVSEDKGSLEK
jgi:hypothetical protein